MTRLLVVRDDLDSCRPEPIGVRPVRRNRPPIFRDSHFPALSLLDPSSPYFLFCTVGTPVRTPFIRVRLFRLPFPFVSSARPQYAAVGAKSGVASVVHPVPARRRGVLLECRATCVRQVFRQCTNLDHFIFNF